MNQKYKGELYSRMNPPELISRRINFMTALTGGDLPAFRFFIQKMTLHVRQERMIVFDVEHFIEVGWTGTSTRATSRRRGH
jgi:hypothetical protein